MATIRVLSSSSKANGYIIETHDGILILECGVPVKVALREIGYQTRKIKGVLCSHQHMDHARYIKEYAMFSDVYTNDECISNLNYKSNAHVNSLEVLKATAIGSFVVIPFLCNHDVKNYGYIIKHLEFGTIFFGTDTYAYNHIFKGVDHWLVEANYDERYTGDISGSQLDRLMLSHMSLDYCVKYLHECNAEKSKTITLIHLSSRHSNEVEFKERVQREFGVPTYIADKDVVVSISKYETLH